MVMFGCLSRDSCWICLTTSAAATSTRRLLNKHMHALAQRATTGTPAAMQVRSTGTGCCAYPAIMAASCSLLTFCCVQYVALGQCSSCSDCACRVCASAHDLVSAITPEISQSGCKESLDVCRHAHHRSCAKSLLMYAITRIITRVALT